MTLEHVPEILTQLDADVAALGRLTSAHSVALGAPPQAGTDRRQPVMTPVGVRVPRDRVPIPAGGSTSRRHPVLLALAILLLIVAIAGGVIIHPILFVLAIVALVMFFSGRRGAAL